MVIFSLREVFEFSFLKPLIMFSDTLLDLTEKLVVTEVL